MQIRWPISPDYQVPSKFGWETGIFIGLVLGGFFASWLSGDRSARTLPPLWQQRFGSSKPKSFAFAFLAGFIMIYGARLAGGCTSGHGISGSLQLSVSSWMFFLSLFASGLATAFLLFRRTQHTSQVDATKSNA